MTASAARQAKSVAAEQAFRDRVAEFGGTVVGHYVNRRNPVECLCGHGHACRPSPGDIQRGQGLCLVCAGRDPATAESAFRERVAASAARVVGPYLGSHTPVTLICAYGHECQPQPAHLQQGRALCGTCSARAVAKARAAAAEGAFRARVWALGGRVVGKWVGTTVPVECVCAEGHACFPWPNNTQRGVGICRKCKSKVWDVFYVTTSPAKGRLKFGVTSKDERRRLATHRAAGYPEAVRVIRDLPSALALERHVRAALRDAGDAPVQGREYFDISVLALVLDVVDGWST